MRASLLLNMSKHDGAKLWPQRFPEKAVLQWKTLLKESSECNVIAVTGNVSDHASHVSHPSKTSFSQF